MIQMRFIGERRPVARITMIVTDGDRGVKRQTMPFVASSKVRHEPVYSRLGFDWGEDNASTVELARAILRRVYPGGYTHVLNDAMYKRFAAEVVAKLPRDAFEMTDATVQAWVGGQVR